MKRSLFFLAIVVLPVLLVAINTRTMGVRTPELFGDGEMYFIHADDYVLGYIDAWGGWLIAGSEADCAITQLFGLPIGGAEEPVACYMNFRGNTFTGWIDFRGHRRKFCGAVAGRSLPAKCYGE